AGARYGRAHLAVRHGGRRRERRRRRVAGQRPALGAGMTDSPVADPVRRLPELTYFFPAHNEVANLRGLVEEALETLPGLAERFEVVIVDDGSRDDTPRIADELAGAH